MDDRLSTADIYEAFSHARERRSDLFPLGVVTPESILCEFREKGHIITWNDVRLCRGDMYRLSLAAREVLREVVAELERS